MASVLVVTACTGSPVPSVTSGETGVDAPSPSVDPDGAAGDDGAGAGGAAQEPTGGPDAGGSGQTAAEETAQDGDRAAGAVESSLRALASAQSSVTRDQVRAAIEEGFTDAGVVPDEIEVSIDSTPTGLDVDAIQGAGRTGETCVVGEIRESDVSVAVLPVLGSGHCFVGDQR